MFPTSKKVLCTPVKGVARRNANRIAGFGFVLWILYVVSRRLGARFQMSGSSGSKQASEGDVVLMDAFCDTIVEWEKHAALSCDDSRSRLFDVVMVSTGGVGTTSTIEKLQQDWRINSIVDDDSLKHRPFHLTTKTLEGLVQTNSMVACATPLFVYAFGDIAGSVFSLYRRPGFAEAQNLKTNEYPFPDTCFPKDAFEYAREGVDYLTIESHFHSFLHGGLCSKKVPVFFLRIEREMAPGVWDTLQRAIQNPLQEFEQNITPATPIVSHYSTDAGTSASYQTLFEVYERVQKQLNSLGHLSVAFNGKLTRLL